MFKSQLEPPSENFAQTQIFVENIFDTVKKAREAKAARSLAESKLASYDYSFDFSPSKRKKTRKNAKGKNATKNGKIGKTTPKKKPRKPRTPKDSAEKKKKTPTTPKTPRKYTKRAKVKPQNDIDDEEAAFILSSISQRSFDSFYNRLNGNSHVEGKIEIPLETTTVIQPAEQLQQPPQLQQQPSEPNHLTAYHHVLLDHNYWIVEPPTPSTVIATDEPEKINNESQTNMNLLLTVASHELTSQCTQPNSTNSIKIEVNNNKLPLLDVNCETPKHTNGDNAVKKRWLRQATTECSPSPTVTPPETSPNDMKAPLKKRRVVREIDDANEIKIGACSETESSKIDQTMCFESNNYRNNVEAIKFSNNNNINFVNNSTLIKCEPAENVNINLRGIHEKIEMEFGRQKNEQVVVKEEPRSVIQSPQIMHHGVKNNLTYGIQMSSPVDVNAIYGRSESVLKIDPQKEIKNVQLNEIKHHHSQIYDEKLIKLEPEKSHDYKPSKVNIVEVKMPQIYGVKTEPYDNIQHAVKPENFDPIKIESPIQEKIITVDGKLQQILDGKIQKIYRDNSQYFVDGSQSRSDVRQIVDQKVPTYDPVKNYGQFYSNKVSEPMHQMSVIQGISVPESPENLYRNQMENLQKLSQQNHIIIHTGNLQSMNDKMAVNLAQNSQNINNIYGDNHMENFQKINQLSPTKIGQLKGLSSPTKIQISPTRTYEIYTKNPHENVAESLLKLQQESPVKLLEMSPTKVFQNPGPRALTFSESASDHGYQKKAENAKLKVKKAPKAAKVKTKVPKVKKTPAKAKKVPKPKKVKVPKVPKVPKAKKNNAKIDKNLIKNFGNLEDVPLKMRQNFGQKDEELTRPLGKLNNIDSKVDGVFMHNTENFLATDLLPKPGALIPQFDADRSPHFLNIEKCNKIFNDIEHHKSIKMSKRTASESSSGSSRTSTCSSQPSRCSMKSADFIRSPVPFEKNSVKRLKFEEFGSDQDGRKSMSNDVTDGVSNSVNNLSDCQNFKSITFTLENELKETKTVRNSQEQVAKTQESINTIHENEEISKKQDPSFLDLKLKESCFQKVEKNVNESPIKFTESLKEYSESLVKSSDSPIKTNESPFKLHDSPTKLQESILKFQESSIKAELLPQKLENCEASTLVEDVKPINLKFESSSSENTCSLKNSLDGMNIDSKLIESIKCENLDKTVTNSNEISKKILNMEHDHPKYSNFKSEMSDSAIGSSESSKSSTMTSKFNSDSTKSGSDSSKPDAGLTHDTSVSFVTKSESSGVNAELKSSQDTSKLISDVGNSSKEISSPLRSVIESVILAKNSSESKTPDVQTSKDKEDLILLKIESIHALKTNNGNIGTIDELQNHIKTTVSLIEPLKATTSSLTSDKSIYDSLDTLKSNQDTSLEKIKQLKELSETSEPELDIVIPTIDPLASIKPVIETLESLKSSISAKTSDSISPIPEKVVEQQVASILEKVIPKTLKTDFVKELETEVTKTDHESIPIETENVSDDEDETPYRESVEEFHKDTLEKLMQANKRFYKESVVHNPFKHSVSYDGRDSVRYSKSDDHSRSNRGYDHDDHRKPLKMSLSFDSHQQYQHHNYPPHGYQRSVSEVFNDPRKERWSGNGMYENRSYGSFHYEKIHHRDPITTTYSMYRAQKASQIDSRWNNRHNFEYQQEPQHTSSNFVPEKPPVVAQTQPITPVVINTYRPPPPEPVKIEPQVLAVSPQAEVIKTTTVDPFAGIFEKANASPAVLPKTKTASSDPRLNPSLVQDVKKEEPATPKKKLSLDQYRKRKSLTNVTQISPSEEIVPSISVSISESPPSSLPPAFDPTIAAAAATG